MAEGALTAWAAVTLAFFALRLAAGDPVASLLAQGLTSPAQAETIRRSLGLDLPILAQYIRYLARLPAGDFGLSLYSGQAVTGLIRNQLGPTLELGFGSLAIAIALGLVLGVLPAWNRRSLPGRLAPTLSGLATALPVATTGVLALLLFGLGLRWVGGQERWIALGRTALPALVLGYAASGPIARAIQAGLSESLQAPFMLAARARGIQRKGRLLWHALRPSMPPALSLVALEAAFLFSGTVVTETVFSRPGLGRLLIRAILQGDFPLAQGIIGLAAAFYVTSHVLADSLNMILDPRLYKQREQAPA